MARALTERPTLSRSEAARRLMQAREDVAELIQRRNEDLREGYRVMDTLGALYESITGEEVPEFQMRYERAG